VSEARNLRQWATGAGEVDAERPASYLRQGGLANRKVPAHWFFVDELPHPGSDKVRKGELRA